MLRDAGAVTVIDLAAALLGVIVILPGDAGAAGAPPRAGEGRAA